MGDTSNKTSGEGPLSGIRVFDLSQVIAGPHCTTILADLGAEVLKIERPDGGDDLRGVGRYKGREDHEDYFYANNRSKKSICLNLKDADDQAVAYSLVACADIVVENFAPGTAARLGMGWEDLSPINPRLVYCSISGFGQDGPYQNRLALDPIIQAVTGVMSAIGTEDSAPLMIGAPLADVISGIYSACYILGALHEVQAGGKGRYIDVSMQDSMLSALGPRMGESLQAGANPLRLGNQNPMRVPADTYQTSDGKYISIIVQNERFWAPFCRVVSREDFIADERYKTAALRVQHREELTPALVDVFASKTASEWSPILEAERIPFAVVNTYLEALADPQVKHRGTLRELDHPESGKIRVVGSSGIMTGSTAPPFAPPLLNQHVEEVLKDWLDWSGSQIQEFCASQKNSRHRK
jgi:crotonobetainyl-CoA:carnitine CoA-transferase CaiB-like acyl-CoA transferase